MPVSPLHFVLVSPNLGGDAKKLEAAKEALAMPGVTGPIFRLDDVDVMRGDAGDFSKLHAVLGIMQPNQLIRLVIGMGQVQEDTGIETVRLDVSVHRQKPVSRLYSQPWGPKRQLFGTAARARIFDYFDQIELTPRLHSHAECPISSDPEDAELQLPLSNPAPYAADLTQAWAADGFTGPDVLASACGAILGESAAYAQGRPVCCPIVSPAANPALYNPVSDAIVSAVTAAGAQFVFQNLCLVPGLPMPWAVRTAQAKGMGVSLQLGTGLTPNEVAAAMETGKPWNPLWWESHPSSAAAASQWLLAQAAAS